VQLVEGKGILLVMSFKRALSSRFSKNRSSAKKKRPASVRRRKKSQGLSYLSISPRPEPVSVPVPVPVSTPTPIRSESAPGLQIGDLIRPGKEIQSHLEGFLLDQRSQHTRRAYAKDLKRLVKYLIVRSESHGRHELMGRTVLVGFKDWLLSEGLQHSSVDRHLASLRSLFSWFVEEGVMEKNPAERVRFLKPQRMSQTVGFTDEEVRRILSLPNLHKRSGAQHYAILMILFYCGLRRSELCLLQTTNVSVDRGHPLLRLTGKGNKERIVVMPKGTWNAIKYHLYIAGRSPDREGYLFGSGRKPMDPSNIYYIVRRYAKKAGIQGKVSPHSCRSTAISNARDHQVPDRAIQEFAGWSSPSMIVHYDKRKTSIDQSASHSIHYGQEEKNLPAWLKDDDAWNLLVKGKTLLPRELES